MSDRPYFVILGAMRTGSNLLEKTMEALGDTVCFGEAFNPGFIGGPQKEDVLGWSMIDRDADPMGFLSEMRSADPEKIAGFRLFNAHSPVILAHVLSDPDCHRIVLRRDPVESFISLQIARETGQWLLKNPLRRKTTKVHFDPAQFDAYRSTLAKHYGDMFRTMEAAGTMALHIDYADLSRPGVIAQAAHHIGSKGVPPAGDVILKQNPERLAEKVINYNEMSAHLGLPPEPVDLNPKARLDNLFVPRTGHLAYAPMAGPGFEAAASILHRIEQHRSGGAAIPHGRMLAMTARGELFPFCRAVDELESRSVFTLTSHPLRRLHRLFETELFGAARQFSAIRAIVKERMGRMPGPKAVGGPECALGPEGHREAFSIFLELVTETAKGEGRLVMQEDWYSQAGICDAYRKVVPDVQVFRTEALETFLEWVGLQFENNPLDIDDIQFAARRAGNSKMPIADVCTSDILEEVLKLHPDDFERFGYARCPDDIEDTSLLARKL